MKKYDNPDIETFDAFNAEFAEKGLDTVMSFTILIDDKLKPLPYKITKCSPTEKHKTGDDINIILNEDIFIQLPNELQKLLIIEIFSGISYDYEKDVAVIVKPDFNTYSGVMERFSYDEVVVLKESIKSLYQKGKQDEDESKAITGK